MCFLLIAYGSFHGKEAFYAKMSPKTAVSVSGLNNFKILRGAVLSCLSVVDASSHDV